MTQDTLGRPLADLRISVTDRCNFRCPYCMPAERFGAAYKFLPREEILSFEEIARLARLACRLGARKIRLTGGEPLLRDGLTDLVGMLAGIEGLHDLTLTTNGYHLAAMAEPLKRAGLHRVTVSLDSLDARVFQRLNGRGMGPDRILEGIGAAGQAGLRPLKVNAVVVRGVNDDSVVDLVRYFRGTGVLMRFIEYMDVGSLNGWRMDQVVPAREILARIAAAYPLEPVPSSYRGEVARRYRYLDGQGEIGMIASVTAPFCGDCTRARLSTDGKLYTCLFGTHGTDLRGPMRAGAADQELLDLMDGAWRRRSDRYSEERSSQTPAPAGKVEMYQIGG